MDKSESKRIHEDWWNKCRTCRFWTGNRETMDPGKCSNEKSDMFGQETWTEGHCKKWDTFDIDVALELMEEWNKIKG
jgi:hypothetical protein